MSPGGSGQQVSPAEMAKIMEAQKSMQRLMMAGGNSAEAIKHQQMLASAMASRLPPPPMPYNMAALNNPMSMPMALRG